MKRISAASVLCICIVMPAFGAPTGTVTMNYLGWGAAPHATISLYADADGTYPPYEVAIGSGLVAGYYKHEVTAATGDGVYVGNPLLGFCIDLSQAPSYLSATYDVVPLTEAPDPTFTGSPMTAAQAHLLAELWGRHFSAAMTNQQAAQFQLAVWEIVFETSGTYDVTTGSVWSNHLQAGTNALLGSLDGSGPMARLVALTHPQHQDMLAAIPAPGAISLGGLGTLVIGWLRSRRRL